MKHTASCICLSANKQADISLESTLQFSNTPVKACPTHEKHTDSLEVERKTPNLCPIVLHLYYRKKGTLPIRLGNKRKQRTRRRKTCRRRPFQYPTVCAIRSGRISISEIMYFSWITTLGPSFLEFCEQLNS